MIKARITQQTFFQVQRVAIITSFRIFHLTTLALSFHEHESLLTTITQDFVIDHRIGAILIDLVRYSLRRNTLGSVLR